MYRRRSLLGVALAMLLPLTSACLGGYSGITIKWFCCLGSGDDPSQLKVEAAVIDAFNKSHQNIRIVWDHTAYNGARDALSTELPTDNAPDIVGPLGVGGAEAFTGQWLDLTDLIKKNKLDLSVYQAGTVDAFKIGHSGQQGIPFAIYPSELYFQPDMFKEAGLANPPQKYGEKYTLDGKQVDWNYETVRQVAMRLTIDKNGKDATQAAFDPSQIVQYGFEPQRDDMRGMLAYFGPGKLAGGADGKTVEIPEAWAGGMKWIYDGIWKDHFIMTYPVWNSTEYNGGGYAFNSGKVAMQENFLWDVCCVTDAGKKWDLGALPSYNGKVTAPLNIDTFQILKKTKHPDEAFTVLTYLLGPAEKQLLNAYSGFPARSALQSSFFTQLEQQKDDSGAAIYPPKVDWQVAIDGFQYRDDPNFESYMPAYNQSVDLTTTYLTEWTSKAGLDMDQQIAKLKAQLQGIWDKAK
jgi:multiple sugar transport system substrate-binding protein